MAIRLARTFSADSALSRHTFQLWQNSCGAVKLTNTSSIKWFPTCCYHHFHRLRYSFTVCFQRFQYCFLQVKRPEMPRCRHVLSVPFPRQPEDDIMKIKNGHWRRTDFFLVCPSVMLSKPFILSWEVVKDEVCRTNVRVDLIKSLLRNIACTINKKLWRGPQGFEWFEHKELSFNKMEYTGTS